MSDRVQGWRRGVAAIAVLVAVVAAALVLHAQFDGEDQTAAGYVLAGAFAVWWGTASPGTFWLRDWDIRPAPPNRWGPVLQVVGLLGQGAIGVWMIVHYATARLDDVRVDPMLGLLVAIQAIPALLELVGKRLAGIGTAYPITPGDVARMALGWAAYVVIVALARFPGEWAAAALWWVPELLVDRLPDSVPRWFAIGATTLLWMMVVGFATGILQYRTAFIERRITVSGQGPYASHRSYDRELNPPMDTGLDPVLRLRFERILREDGYISGTGVISGGYRIGTYSGESQLVAKLFEVQVPPAYLPFWLQFRR